MSTAGLRFRAALAAEPPLQMTGAFDANPALRSTPASLKSRYRSDSAVVGAPPKTALRLDSLDAPLIDQPDHRLTDRRRIADACDPSLPADIGTGFLSTERPIEFEVRLDARHQKNKT